MEIEKVEIKSEIPENYLLNEDGSETETSELINQKPYKCGICGHRTTADTLLKVHMKMHFVKRLHRCHVCKESFSFVTELNTHILTHSREVSGFRCEHCGKDCFTDEDLHRHYRIHTKEKPYRCKLCLRCFSEEFYLRAHERSHHGEEYAKRNMMQDGTFVDPSLVQHLSDDSIKEFQCEICHKYFSNEEFLKIHYEAHVGEDFQNSIFSLEEENIPKSMLLTDISDSYLEKCRTTVTVEDRNASSYECSYVDKNGIKCSRRFGEKTAFYLHVKSHETVNEQKIFCHICKIYCKDDLKLFRHMKAKHSTQIEEPLPFLQTSGEGNDSDNSDFPKKKERTGFKCTVCSKIFPVPAKLRIHIRTHTGEKPFKCDICQKSFGTAGSLKDHSYLHLEERPFKCTICNKGFVKNNALENHIRSHTGEKPYECNICQKRYTSPVILNQHLLAHSKEKPFKCDVCNKSFIYLCTLKYHMVIHTDSKPFKCSYCDKSFSLRNSLHLHEKEHTGDKPHKCKYCTKSFTTVGSLKKHERIHTGEKPYVCNICNKGFTQSSALSRHMDSHTGEKPYICHICNKGLTSATYLKVHLRIHNGEPPYKCIHCNKSFTVNLKYRAHVKQHKKEKEVVHFIHEPEDEVDVNTSEKDTKDSAINEIKV